MGEHEITPLCVVVSSLSSVLPTSQVFTSGYVNTETILHFFYKITNERGTKTVFTYAHVKWFYGQSECAYYLNYFIMYNIQWNKAFFHSLTHLLPKFFQTALKELLLRLYLCFKYQPWQNWKENVKCTCNRHIVFRYRWSQQSLPVNQSDFVHSIWNDFIKLSGCHFTHG